MIQALYRVEFGDVSSPEAHNAGVAAWRDGRVTGGDNGYFYIGSYAVEGDRVNASIKVTKHNPQAHNAFGDEAASFDATITGTLRDDGIEGTMQRADKPETSLGIRLTKLSDLPES